MNINTASNQLLEDNSTSFKDRFPEFSGARMVYALGGRSLFWNCTVPRPIESELRKWPINYRELEAYYSMAEKSLNASISYSKGSSMQNLLLRKLYSKGILEARDLPLAFDMEASRKGQMHSNPWYSSIDSSTKDEFGMPLIQVDYSLSDRDYEVVNQMSRGIVEAANAMGIALNPATVALRPPGSSMHESCTCRIGTNPETSAANPHGQIHGIEGLFVADSSALPSLSASGPTISNIALSMRVADYIYLKET